MFDRELFFPACSKQLMNSVVDMQVVIGGTISIVVRRFDTTSSQDNDNCLRAMESESRRDSFSVPIRTMDSSSNLQPKVFLRFLKNCSRVALARAKQSRVSSLQLNNASFRICRFWWHGAR